MILIDAVKLKKSLPKYADYREALAWIDEAEEVDAIPIETIKKEIERLKEDIKWAWYYGNTALDKMEYLKMWLEIKLEDWEAERGADK